MAPMPKHKKPTQAANPQTNPRAIAASRDAS
jgi:hypothetical protein